MVTLLGEYLNKLAVNKAEVGRLSDIKIPRMNDLCNKDTAKPSPEEYYKIVYIANKLAGLDELEFSNSIEEIFPERPKNKLLKEFSHLPADVKFLKKHTQKQSFVEGQIGMANGKISKLASEKTKDLLAVEIICFIEAIELDVLETFKEIYGKIGEIEGTPLPNPAVLNERTNSIYQYIEAYNQSDVLNMITNMADAIVFVNIANNQPSMQLEGIDEFKKRAVEAISYFSHRQQTIISMTHRPNSTEIIIDYKAIAAVDLPNEIKKGDEIKLRGKSIFEFSEEGKIIELTDIS